MATFEAQVEALTSLSLDGSSAPTQTELTQFLTDGAKEVINSFGNNYDLLSQCAAKQSTFTSAALESEAETLNTGKVLTVYLTHSSSTYPCRKINPNHKYYYADGSSFASAQMEQATVTDPVYYIQNNKINAIPASKTVGYSEVQYPAVAYGDSAIAVFPDEAEYLVPLYASIKSLQNAMAAKASNSDITTALTAVNTELDETQAVCDELNGQVDSAVTALSNMATEIALANQEVDDALSEIAEAISLTDSAGSGIQLAVDKMASANLKFRADGDDPALFGDESTYTTGSSAMTSVKTYVDRAISYINGNFPHADYDLAANLSDVDSNLGDEDTELAAARIQQAQLTLSAAQADLQIAQTYITEWNTMVQTLVSEVQAFSSEASSRFGWISAKASVWQGELSAAQGYMNTAGGYASQASGFNANAQGYANEVQTKINIAQGYINEIQSRLSVLTTEYTWMEKQQVKLQADYDRGIQLLRGAPSQ